MDAEEFNQGRGAGGGGDLSMGADEFTPGCGGAGAGTTFTLLTSDAKDYLCIPQDVSDQFRHLFPFGPIQLEDPDGHVYTVQVVKLGPITLATGWRLFVDENHIQQGDPILFVNCGRYKFKVQRAGPPRVLNEQVAPDPAQIQTSTHDDYDLFPGTCLTIQQEEKVLELAASSMRSGIKLHVAAMKKRNANKDFYVYIPLRLLDKFKEGITVATIRLEAHGNGMIYAVSASTCGGDQIILKSGLSRFVASLRIQDNDLLVFGSKGKDRLEVRVLDPKGCEKTMANSSNAQQVCEGSVEIVDPPSHTVTDSVVDLSSDDDEVMGEGTATARRKQKMPSTSSPYTKSGHKAGKLNEAGLEAPMSHKPYIFTKLDWQREPEVKEKVHAIESKFPVFVKQMSASDILKPAELYFCMEYAMAVCLPLKPTPVILGLEGSEMQWLSMLVVCKKVRRICSFWKDLVLEAKMKQGDICLVELVERSSEGLTMMVHLIRK